jgi:large subunit ribosomal protein L24
MIQSSKPRQQRKFRYNAPMHLRQHFLHVHVDKALRAKLKLNKRTVQIAKGDTVKIMAGSKRGNTGKVTGVSLRKGSITIDSLVRKNARGKELQVPIRISNVYVTDLNLTDKRRAAKLKVAAQQKQPEAKAPVQEKKPAADAPARPEIHEVAQATAKQ